MLICAIMMHSVLMWCEEKYIEKMSVVGVTVRDLIDSLPIWLKISKQENIKLIHGSGAVITVSGDVDQQMQADVDGHAAPPGMQQPHIPIPDPAAMMQSMMQQFMQAMMGHM